MIRHARAVIFDSFEAENEAEYRRRAGMTSEQRWREMASLQERTWGKGWGSRPIVKTATWESADW